jgi:signal transduction histidine kinase
VQEALSNIPPTVAIQLSLNLFRLKRELLVTIQDDGRGIRPEDMEKAESLGLDGHARTSLGDEGRNYCK